MSMVATKFPYILILRDDTDTDSPRQDDCFGKMVCWHRRYNLGDKHDYSDPDEFLRRLVREKNIPDKELIEYIKSGQSDTVKLEYDRSARQWDVRSYDSQFKKWFTDCSFDAPLTGKEIELADALAESMQMDDLMAIAEKHNCILPLYLYDHSGITMNTTGFSCPWDSGQVGWVYASHKDIKKEYGSFSEENAEKAMNLLRGEVTYYDHYIRGDCYGFQLYNGDEEVDSCWGFIGSPDDLREDIEGYLPDEAKGIMNNLVFRYDDPDIDDILQEYEDELEVG